MDLLVLTVQSSTLCSISESESESALFAKCVQTHEEFVVVFKKLLVHTCNMNFTKDVVLCEIIERHESKSIIVVVNFFYCRIIIQSAFQR